MPLKVYLDTNVIISGLLSEEGPPRIILDILSLSLPELKGVTGEFNMLELKANIKKKLPRLEKPFFDAAKKLNLEIVGLPESEAVSRLKEIIAFKDAPVLASALGAGCDYLITGDKHFRAEGVKKAGLKIKIVSPAEFVEEVLPRALKAGLG
ncbi:MAG: PIN domain-containing protein [Thermodesulfovibrionales bacterium]|nr:PIN domain-containing protein [Thermodesulfovibrionales bacterium]